jgi:hypothetical protein
VNNEGFSAGAIVDRLKRKNILAVADILCGGLVLDILHGNEQYA